MVCILREGNVDVLEVVFSQGGVNRRDAFMSTPVADIRPESANTVGPVLNRAAPGVLRSRLRKMAVVLLPVSAVLVALTCWAFGAGKLPWTPPAVEQAGPPAKEALAVELAPGKPNSLLVPEEVQKSLGILKGKAVQVAVAEQPSRKRPLVMPGSTALDPAGLIRVRVRFAPAEVVEIGKIADPHASPGIVPPLRRDLQTGDPVKKGDLLAVLYSIDLGNKKNDLFDALSQLRLDKEVLKRARPTKRPCRKSSCSMPSATCKPTPTPSAGPKTP